MQKHLQYKKAQPSKVELYLEVNAYEEIDDKIW